MRSTGSRVVVAVAAAACVFAVSGCCPCEWQEPTLAALGGRDHGFISRRGAHTYVGVAGTPENGAGDAAGFLNAMFTREYSDLMSHFGQYKPVLGPLVEPAAGGTCVPWARRWDGTSVTQWLECDVGGVVMETAYTGVDRVSVRVEVMSGWGADSLTLRGCQVDNGDGMLVSSLGRAGGVTAFEQEETLYSFWGVQEREIRRIEVGILPRPLDGPGIDGPCWWASVDPGDKTIVNFGMAADWGAEATFDGLPDAPAPLDFDGFEAAIINATTGLEAWFNGAPIPDREDPMAVMSWYLLWENTAGPWGEKWTHEAVVPSKRHYFRGVWLWDAAFIAAALARGNADARALGMDQVRLVIDNQAVDGRFPREIWAHDAGTGFQPPGLLTWAAIDLANGENDYAFLKEVYDALAANHRWVAENTDSDGDGRCEWTKEDSGMDTSPRFDDGPVEGVDLQCWMALDAELLGRVAYYIGRDADRAAWEGEAAARKDDVRNSFWDADDQVFYDRKIDDQAADPFVRVATPVTFLPLFVRAATDEQAAAVAARLSDDAFFAAPFGIPTVPVTSPEYESGNYWRGPVWIVTNAFAIWGLDQYNLWRESNELRDSTLSMIAASATPWEYYDSQSGAGRGSPDFMWSGVFYLLLGSGGIPTNYH